MKVVFLTGSHPRHMALAKAIERTGKLAGLVIEEREDHIPAVPLGLSAALAELFVRHFGGRAEAEETFFGDAATDRLEVPTLRIQRKHLNTSRVRGFVSAQSPTLVLSYGVHKLTEATLNSFPEARWNIHGGLSPQYRGVITHFWPSYMLEPKWTGVTLHELSDQLDAGAIIHQTAAPLVRGDGIHQLACRAVLAFAEEFPKVLEMKSCGQIKPPVGQNSPGKLWVGSDWRPEHLKVVYETYGNRIVDAYLDGLLGTSEPTLVRQF